MKTLFAEPVQVYSFVYTDEYSNRSVCYLTQLKQVKSPLEADQSLAQVTLLCLPAVHFNLRAVLEWGSNL